MGTHLSSRSQSDGLVPRLALVYRSKRAKPNSSQDHSSELVVLRMVGSGNSVRDGRTMSGQDTSMHGEVTPMANYLHYNL